MISLPPRHGDNSRSDDSCNSSLASHRQAKQSEKWCTLESESEIPPPSSSLFSSLLSKKRCLSCHLWPHCGKQPVSQSIECLSSQEKHRQLTQAKSKKERSTHSPGELSFASERASEVTKNATLSSFSSFFFFFSSSSLSAFSVLDKQALSCAARAMRNRRSSCFSGEPFFHSLSLSLSPIESQEISHRDERQRNKRETLQRFEEWAACLTGWRRMCWRRVNSIGEERK